jgi:hypothetical protein
MRKMPMAVHAVDEDEVADGPADRTERLFFDGTVVKEQRDMRREIATPQMSQAIPSRECRGERPPEYFQPLQAVAAGQNERTASRLTAKAHGAVERNLEGLGPHFADRLTRLFD